MMKKRRYGVLLAGLLCICMAMSLPALAVDSDTPAASGGEAVFELSYPSELPAVGETFEVTVSLKNNPGFHALEFTLYAEEDTVICETIAEAGILDKSVVAVNPEAELGARLTSASLSEITEDGMLAGVRYRVVKPGNLSFSLKEVRIFDSAGNKYAYSVSRIAQNSASDGNESDTIVSKPDDTQSEEPFDQNQPENGPSDSPIVQPGDSPEVNPGEEPSRTHPEGTVPVQYSDVAKSHWAYDYICQATDAGLFNGFPDGSFHPDENVTRAQFITVLWRMSGSPQAGSQSSFVDTPSDAYYIDAVRWGTEKGYINGVENADGTFSYLPGDKITREQVMTILFRYDGEKSGMESLFTSTYDNQFADSGDISDYARKAMYWAYFKTYITGTSANMLSPKGLATRAQISKILVEYLSGHND